MSNNMKAKLKEEVEEDPEDKVPVNLYLEPQFKEYVKEKYLVDNPELLNN